MPRAESPPRAIAVNNARLFSWESVSHCSAIGGAVLGLGGQLYLSKSARLTRRIRDALVAPSRLSPNERRPRFVGNVAYLGAPLVSPLTGRACAYYDIHVVRSGGVLHSHSQVELPGIHSGRRNGTRSHRPRRRQYHHHKTVSVDVGQL